MKYVCIKGQGFTILGIKLKMEKEVEIWILIIFTHVPGTNSAKLYLTGRMKINIPEY